MKFNEVLSKCIDGHDYEIFDYRSSSRLIPGFGSCFLERYWLVSLKCACCGIIQVRPATKKERAKIDIMED